MTDKAASIHVLMSRVMSEIGAIEKSQRNTHFNFNFRGIDDVMNALHGPLTKHGVFFVPQVQASEVARGDKQWHATVTVRYEFFGPLGDSVTATVTAEGLDSSDKAATKAMSTALKYALLQVFCIPTEEQREIDPDRSSQTWEEGGAQVTQSRTEKPGSGATSETSAKSAKGGDSEAAGTPVVRGSATDAPKPSETTLLGGVDKDAHLAFLTSLPWDDVKKSAREVTMERSAPVPIRANQLEKCEPDVLAEIVDRVQKVVA